MQLILKRDWEVPDGNTGKNVTLHAGTHEVERIPNPCGYSPVWIVLKGTQIGATEGFWRQWENGLATDPKHPNYVADPEDLRFGKSHDWGKFEVVIIE